MTKLISIDGGKSGSPIDSVAYIQTMTGISFDAPCNQEALLETWSKCLEGDAVMGVWTHKNRLMCVPAEDISLIEFRIKGDEEYLISD